MPDVISESDLQRSIISAARELGSNYRINCSKCGRFIDRQGFADIMWDEWNGGYEMGYPLCAKHFSA